MGRSMPASLLAGPSSLYPPRPMGVKGLMNPVLVVIAAAIVLGFVATQLPGREYVMMAFIAYGILAAAMIFVVADRLQGPRLDRLAKDHDPTYGGFGGAPKYHSWSCGTSRKLKCRTLPANRGPARTKTITR